MPSHVFKIEQGKFGLSIVDPAAPGYDSSWQTPTGADAQTAKLADYVSGGLGDFTCQVTSGALSASPNTSDETTPATFCGPEETVTNVGVTSYTVDVSFLQDPDLVAGLNRYLFEHDTEEAFFYLSLNNDMPPKAVGRCRIIAGTIGGDARTTLTADLSLPCSRKPDAVFGNSDSNFVIIEGGGGTGSTPATGATAGTPGTFTPGGSSAPADLAALSTVTASPSTAWATGEYVVLGDASHAYWDGAGWVAGEAP